MVIFVSGCFKKHHLNENALLHQRACIESIELNDYIRAETHCSLCLEYARVSEWKRSCGISTQ
jgi:hypothetical protein